MLNMLLHVPILMLMRISGLDVTGLEDLESSGRDTPAHLLYRGCLGCQSRARVRKRWRVGPSPPWKQRGGVCISMTRVCQLYMTGWGLAESHWGMHRPTPPSDHACLFIRLVLSLHEGVWCTRTRISQCLKQPTNNNHQPTHHQPTTNHPPTTHHHPPPTTTTHHHPNQQHQHQQLQQGSDRCALLLFGDL